ncbi:MAG: DNA/RNA nuclease SfsA, partial [Fibrobacterota bacterium]
MTFFSDRELHEATFLSRPNRFVVRIRIAGTLCSASLPNPGKLQELFFPGTVLLVYSMVGRKSTYNWRVAAVISRRGETVMLDTQVTNRVAEYLLRNKMIPSLKEYDLVRREVTCGHSRFDFLLSRGGQDYLLEVKSCTQFHGSTGLFPDAQTTRGARHVQELTALRKEGTETGVLFIVHSADIRRFTPDFHTDPAFSAVLSAALGSVDIICMGVSWDRNLQLHVAREVPLDMRAWEK